MPVLQAFLDKYQEEEEKEVERIKQKYDTFLVSFIIREVNSDMPIYILTEQMSEKIKCPEWDSNP